MRPVYAVSGGVSKFAKARPDKTFQAIVKEAYDYAIADIGLDFPPSRASWMARWLLISPTIFHAS
jgi:acetyl-CoA acetyltransferase